MTEWILNGSGMLRSDPLVPKAKYISQLFRGVCEADTGVGSVFWEGEHSFICIVSSLLRTLHTGWSS